MPLVLDVRSHPPAVLRSLAEQLRQDLEETLESLKSPRVRVRDEVAVEQARNLARSVLELGRLLERDEADPSRLAGLVNAEYDALLGVISLMKRGLDVPQVPARRA
jgi:hypothetical protein